MTSDHHRNLDNYLEKLNISDGDQNGMKEPDLPLMVSDLNFNEATLFAVYCFIRNFIGASVASSAPLDTKIGHALDIVKKHLSQAVRLEVEDLKIKINELVDRITYLEYENDVLRANVAPEVLQNLDNTGKM